MKRNKLYLVGAFVAFICLSSKPKGTSTRDDNMALGNPSNATSTLADLNNYLLQKTDYSLSYNNSKGTANWVSWHLSAAWRGKARRKDAFATDISLPVNFVKITPANYKNTGFDKGHICPSNDRNRSVRDNRETFLMTNMIPQAPYNNQQTWRYLEGYCQQLSLEGNEMYIIAGPSGSLGEGENGTAASIADGKVTVPEKVWKVIVVLQNGNDDIKRITSATRVIAVIMPNTQKVNAHSWNHYRVSVDQVEKLTGYDFLSVLPVSLQDTLESRKDTVQIK